MPTIISQPASPAFRSNFYKNFSCCCCGALEGDRYCHDEMVAGSCLRCGRVNYAGEGAKNEKVKDVQPEASA